MPDRILLPRSRGAELRVDGEPVVPGHLLLCRIWLEVWRSSRRHLVRESANGDCWTAEIVDTGFVLYGSSVIVIHVTRFRRIQKTCPRRWEGSDKSRKVVGEVLGLFEVLTMSFAGYWLLREQLRGCSSPQVMVISRALICEHRPYMTYRRPSRSVLVTSKQPAPVAY